MQDRTKVQHLMPLMREYGNLERQRLGGGVTPLEFQRWLDLKGQIGRNFAKSRPEGSSRGGEPQKRRRMTRLLVQYPDRELLEASIVENIQPVGFFVQTPFAADVGTQFLVRVTLLSESITADVPSVVVTSLGDNANTLPSITMGMSLKILRPSPAQAAGISKLFGGLLDAPLGLCD